VFVHNKKEGKGDIMPPLFFWFITGGRVATMPLVVLFGS
jgi:hypothetical protein